MSDDLPGLTSGEARKRLEQYGPNEPVPRRRLSAFAQFGHLFANPLVIILLVAPAISASLGQRVDASITVTIVLLSVSINFWNRINRNRRPTDCTPPSRRLPRFSATGAGGGAPPQGGAR